MPNYRNKRKYKINNLGGSYIKKDEISDNEPSIIYTDSQEELKSQTFKKIGSITNPSHNIFAGSWLITPYNTQSVLASKVVAIHPPIIGTSLINQNYIKAYKQVVTKYQNLILNALKVFINPNYIFKQDDFDGIDLRKIKLNKLLSISNYLDINQEQKELFKETYNMIKMITDFKHDGAVVFEIGELESFQKNSLQEEQHNNQHKDSKENSQKIYNKVMK